MRGYNPDKRADDLALNEIIGLIEKAERPVLYCGGGIISGNASAELRKFAEATQIPVTTTIMGCGAFPETHPLSLRWLGMHGAAYANWAVSGEFKPKKDRNDPNEVPVKIHDGADLLLAFGVRFDDRVTGKVDNFARPERSSTSISTNPSSTRTAKSNWPIESDIKYALTRLNEMVKQRPIRKKFDAWHKQIAEWKTRAPLALRRDRRSDSLRAHARSSPGKESEVILPQYAIELLYELTKGDAIITTGVGQHQMWAGQLYKYKFPRQFITSAGLGAMGFGYPAALGAKVACPDKQVIDIDGDGSFLMNVQELATAHIEKIAAKALILNNQHLGMVVQWEDNFYDGNRGHTYLGDPENRQNIYPTTSRWRKLQRPGGTRHV